MDFRPSESQQLLAATARDFLRKQCPPERLDELAGDERHARELWRAMAELGWTGLLIPGELGGSDGTILDVILLMEEMGRVCLPGPFVDSALVATSLIATAGSAAQRRRLLPALARGERVCALAWLEEGGELAPETMALRLEAGRLTGRKLFVRDADRADDVLVVARGDDGLTLVLVERARAGIEVDARAVHGRRADLRGGVLARGGRRRRCRRRLRSAPRRRSRPRCASARWRAARRWSAAPSASSS